MWIKGGTERQTDGHDEGNSRFCKQVNVSTKFVYERLWVMLPADCDVCTCVVADSGKD